MNLGAPEIIGIVVLALLLFGSRKLPELGSSVGQTITNFRKGMAEAKDGDEDGDDADATSGAPADATAEPVDQPRS
ncbi:twin-arginine translocase TatA/TatE family subunit [Euzebya sp.]|uniref:Sec-independent protein translocase subunit TatA/TatB n=1 Tax=Euzebya sp. TaxID=1971409 RepID=UPI00351755C1